VSVRENRRLCSCYATAALLVRKSATSRHGTGSFSIDSSLPLEGSHKGRSTCVCSEPPNARLDGARFTGVAVQAAVREHHLSGATITPRKPALSIAALTRPSDFASSMNWRAYATPRSRPFGIAIACGSMPGRPSRTREPGN
jgi:hypothetical protein